MSLRWSKRDHPLACPAGSQWYACSSGPRFAGCCTVDPCSRGCPKWEVSATLSRRATNSVGIRDYTSTTANVSSPTSSTNATAASSNQPNVALIAGASAGGFVLLLLFGIIIFFWMHTQKSRRHHNRTFERRLSDPKDAGEMSQKQLFRLSIEVLPAPPHARHQRSASHVYISPDSPLWPERTHSHSKSLSTPSPERRASQHASRSIEVDPHTYRHYSAEDFVLPETPSSDLSAWKTSHKPTPVDLWRKSIGTFELDSPLSPEGYSAATSRKSSLGSRGSSMSRKSSLGYDVSPIGQAVPIPPLPSPAVVAGAWNTHRKNSSSGV